MLEMAGSTLAGKLLCLPDFMGTRQSLREALTMHDKPRLKMLTPRRCS